MKGKIKGIPHPFDIIAIINIIMRLKEQASVEVIKNTYPVWLLGNKSLVEDALFLIHAYLFFFNLKFCKLGDRILIADLQ